jgi:hypothetical protein
MRVLRAELRARRAERERDRIADIAVRAMNKLSDDDLRKLRAELTGEDGKDA